MGGGVPYYYVKILFYILFEKAWYALPPRSREYVHIIFNFSRYGFYCLSALFMVAGVVCSVVNDATWFTLCSLDLVGVDNFGICGTIWTCSVGLGFLQPMHVAHVGSKFSVQVHALLRV
jgi:hypothetical protein